MPQLRMTRQAKERIKRVELDALSEVARGRVSIKLYFSEPSYMYADLRLGSRIARTPLMDVSEVGQMVKDICAGLGFAAEVTEEHPDDFADE